MSLQIEVARLEPAGDTSRGRFWAKRADGSIKYIRNGEAFEFGLTVAVRKDPRIVVEIDASEPVYCRVLNEGREVQQYGE